MNKIKEYLNNLSLKRKWTFSTALVIFCSYAAICILIFFALYNWLLNNEENNALRTMDELSDFFHGQGGSVNINDFQKNTSLVNSIVHHNQTVRIFNVDGYEVIRINDEYPAAELNLSPHEQFDTILTKSEMNQQQVFVVQRPVQIGLFTGIMQLIHPLESFQSLMKYVLTAMLIAGIGALVIALSISNYIATVLLRPLQDLRDSMVSVREKGFDQEISLPYKADDEIGDLLEIYRSMMDELQQTFAKQQQFVSDASHELRTPIQAIEGHLSLIQRWGKNDPEVLAESLQTAIIEVQKMKKMIEELLDLVREEKRDENEVADIIKIIDLIKDEVEVIYKNVIIKVSTIGEVKYPRITENALSQIIRNIVENGIRYNDNQPVINIETHYFSDNIFIKIMDNGIGISEKHLPHIFDRFYRVDESRENVGNGTGLGLSITKMLANKYNVEIDVTSELGIGTVFTLRIPMNNY